MYSFDCLVYLIYRYLVVMLLVFKVCKFKYFFILWLRCIMGWLIDSLVKFWIMVFLLVVVCLFLCLCWFILCLSSLVLVMNSSFCWLFIYLKLCFIMFMVMFICLFLFKNVLSDGVKFGFILVFCNIVNSFFLWFWVFV